MEMRSRRGYRGFLIESRNDALGDAAIDSFAASIEQLVNFLSSNTLGVVTRVSDRNWGELRSRYFSDGKSNANFLLSMINPRIKRIEGLYGSSDEIFRTKQSQLS